MSQNKIKNFIIISASFAAIATIVSGCVMGTMIGDAVYESVTGDYFRDDRDSGIIGEKKTIKPLKIYHEKTTGSTFRSIGKGNFATPLVSGEVAKFDSSAAPFEFECIGWKYRTQNYWSSADETAGRIAPSVHLESPDKRILIYVNEVDLPVEPPLDAHSMTAEQERRMQEMGLVEDPFGGEESLMAAQQAVRWYLNESANDFVVSARDAPLHFSTEDINGKEFVKVEFEILNKKTNTVRKSIIWAYNFRAFWLYDGKRHAYTWFCQIITDPSEYSSAVAKARQIPETAEFKKYIPKNEPEKKIPGIRYLNYRGEVIQDGNRS